MSWQQIWVSDFGLSPELSTVGLSIIAIFSLYILVLFPAWGFFGYIERKVGADLQARIGPNRSGPYGIFQFVSDALKLLQKNPDQNTDWRSGVFLSGISALLYSTVALLPLGTSYLLVDVDMSVFIPILMVLMVALGTIVASFSSDSFPSWLSGIRIAAQSISGALPAVISVISVGIFSGSFRWSEIVLSQGPFLWNVFVSPFLFFNFFAFVLSGLVILNVPPLSSSGSLRDIHGSISTELYGRRLGLYLFFRFYCLFLWSSMAVTLFLGGWNLPLDTLNSLGVELSGGIRPALEAAVVVLKTMALMLTISWFNRVLPKLRVDQITDYTWKVLSPMALMGLVGSALSVALRGLL